MYQQTALVLYKLRFVFSGVFTLSAVILGSLFITALGANTILDTRSHPTIGTFAASDAPDSPNAITTGFSTLEIQAQQATVATGRAIYKTCLAITKTSTQAGKSALHVATVATSTMWHGITFVGKGIGSGVMFTLRLPGKGISAIAHTPVVHAFMRPANTAEVPVIDSQTSEEQLAQYGEAQRQKIADQLAAQLAANESLGGLVIAGSASRGGYPAKWDSARQDSLVDDWGMYNRECVSYAAWKVYQTYGSMPYWGGIGNANQWVANARRAGIPTSSVPKVHSVAISMHGYYGHAMWVEKIEGNMVYVSQYNYDLRGHYSEMWINSSDLTYLYFK